VTRLDWPALAVGAAIVAVLLALVVWVIWLSSR
jgi:hypothetical protein